MSVGVRGGRLRNIVFPARELHSLFCGKGWLVAQDSVARNYKKLWLTPLRVESSTVPVMIARSGTSNVIRPADTHGGQCGVLHLTWPTLRPRISVEMAFPASFTDSVQSFQAREAPSSRCCCLLGRRERYIFFKSGTGSTRSGVGRKSFLSAWKTPRPAARLFGAFRSVRL